MKREDIHFDDWRRVLLGETPPLFLAEVFIRTLVTYIFLLYVLRWLGKRMSGQLTIMELSVMLTLGAIVSASMQLPDHGILEGFLLLLCALAFQRGTSYIGIISSRFEELVQGKAGLLISDGVLQLDALKEYRISRQQIFAQLRSKKVYNLGSVERMYLEANGMYSIFITNDAKPGLSVMPPDDHPIQETERPVVGLSACQSCGLVLNANELQRCSHCGCKEWTNAIK